MEAQRQRVELMREVGYIETGAGRFQVGTSRVSQAAQDGLPCTMYALSEAVQVEEDQLNLLAPDEIRYIIQQWYSFVHV